MGKKDRRQEGNVPNRDIYCRMNFLYQAASFYATLPANKSVTTNPTEQQRVQKRAVRPRLPRRRSCFKCGCQCHGATLAKQEMDPKAPPTAATLPTADDLVATATGSSPSSSSIGMDLDSIAASSAAPAATENLNRKARKQLEREQLVRARRHYRLQEDASRTQGEVNGIDGSATAVEQGEKAQDDKKQQQPAAPSRSKKFKVKRHLNQLASQLASLQPSSSLSTVYCGCGCHGDHGMLIDTDGVDGDDGSQEQDEHVGPDILFPFSRMARFYAATLREVGRKNVIRMDPVVKRTICRRCDSLLVPGVSATVRIQAKPQLNTTIVCNACDTSRSYYCMPGKGIEGDRIEMASQERRADEVVKVTSTPVAATPGSLSSKSVDSKHPERKRNQTAATAAVSKAIPKSLNAELPSECESSSPTTPVEESPAPTESSSTTMEIDG